MPIKPSPCYTLKPDDVGRSIIHCFGRTWMTNFIGRVLPRDVGKRVYLVKANDGSSSILQVENDEQRDERLRKER